MGMSEYANIFDYADFRKFLSDYQERRQEAEPKFTRTAFCGELGLPNTRSYFNDVVHGKAVTAEMERRFQKVLGLSAKESRYFDAMIRFDQAKVEEAREKALQEMMSLSPNPQVIADPTSYELFLNWYNVVLFNLLGIIDVGDELSALEKRIFPPVPQKKLESALQTLQKMSLVQKNEKGFWKPTRDGFRTVNRCKSGMVLQYQKQCLELSKAALESEGRESRDMTTFSVGVSEKGRKRISREVERFKDRIRKIVHDDTLPPTEVEHINLHVFSHLKDERKEA